MESSDSSDDDFPGVRKFVTPTQAPSVQLSAATPTLIQKREMETQTSPWKNNHCLSCFELKATSNDFKIHLEKMKEITLCLTQGFDTLKSGISSLPVPPTPRQLYSSSPINAWDFPDPERILQNHLEKERLNEEHLRSSFVLWTPPPRKTWSAQIPPTSTPHVNLKEREPLVEAVSSSASCASTPIQINKSMPIVSLEETSESFSSDNEDDMNWTSRKTIQACKFPRARKSKISNSWCSELSTVEQMASSTFHSESQGQPPSQSLFNSQSLNQSSAELSTLNSLSANLISVPKAISKPTPLQQKRHQGKPWKNLNQLSKPKKFSCKECSKQFNNKYSLNEHMEFHKGLTKCTFCNFVYSKTFGLKRHLNNIQTPCAEKHRTSQLDSTLI